MALKSYRFKKTSAIHLAELQSRLQSTISLVDDAGGNIVTFSFEEANESDLLEVLQEHGYSLIEGAGGTGVNGTASDDEDRRLLAAKNPVRACTGGVNIAATWTPSGSGRGKTLTSPDDLLSRNSHDGVTLVVGDRLLVKDGVGAAAVHNGVYELIQAADAAGDEAILRRAHDFDDNVEVIPGSSVLVLSGTTCALRTFVMTTAGPITVDTSQLVFAQPNTNDASDSLLFGAGTLTNTTQTRFLFPGYDDSTAQTDAIQIAAPRAGTLRALRVRHNKLGGSPNTVVYTVRINGAPSILTAAVASNAAAGSDLVNSVVVAAGDLIDIQASKAANITGSLRDIVATVDFAA